MSNEVIQIRGKNIVVVPDAPGVRNCLRCAFNLECVTDEESELLETGRCTLGHHYEEVVLA